MRIPDELRPLVSEYERTWGKQSPETARWMKWADENGYAMSALVIVMVYDIHSAIQHWLRDENEQRKALR